MIEVITFCLHNSWEVKEASESEESSEAVSSQVRGSLRRHVKSFGAAIGTPRYILNNYWIRLSMMS